MAPIPASPPPVTGQAPQISQARYGFAGMAIGANLSDLHSIRPKATCVRRKSEIEDCTAPDQPIGGGYLARDLTYRFVGGRLAQIRFHSSIDAFAFVVARLKHDFGEPSDIHRNDVSLDGRVFPHVAFVWRNGRSTTRMSDPNTAGQLAVEITLDAAKAKFNAGSA